jgi:predicted HAD superfamily Cof-like phosphohydrolase
MQTNFERVLEFHETYGQPVGGYPSADHVSKEREDLRNGFIVEEFCELLEAQGYPSEATAIMQKAWEEVKQLQKIAQPNVVGIADALTDIQYFTYGSEVEYGIDGDAVFIEVHESNMSKLGPDGKPIYREDGKVLKGPNYFKPNIEEVLDTQGSIKI